MRDMYRELSEADAARLIWIMRHREELARRHARLMALLQGLSIETQHALGDAGTRVAGRLIAADPAPTVEIDLNDLELARNDLMALLNTMAPPIEDDEDF